MRTVRMGAGSAYWGDLLEPAVELAERGACDYLGFDHLGELTLAILQRQRARDPATGYIQDIVPWTQALLPVARPRGTRIITNAGGANPPAAAHQVVEIARAHGLSGTRVGVLTGDDILDRLRELEADGVRFPNLDTGEEHLERVADRIVAANA
jgi:Acyclic terpene utilisation family protein AtuA